MCAQKLAFVLSGGGARGALQVGALGALFDAGLRPDVLVETSIGAANAAFLALHGADERGLLALRSVWQDLPSAHLLPGNLLAHAMRLLTSRGRNLAREFLLAHGITPELRFGDLCAPRLLVVATDLTHAVPVVFGVCPEDSVLEGVLASLSLPPWIGPTVSHGRRLVDGALVSALPLEPAMRAGATAIVALDVGDPRGIAGGPPVPSLLLRLFETVEQHEIGLELDLAAARGVHLTRIRLQPAWPASMWAFDRIAELMAEGRRITNEALTMLPVAGVPAGS